MKAPTRALVVEDIDSWVFTLTRAARRAGASEIVTCSDLDSLHEALRTARFDIAIVDVGLDPDDDTDDDGVRALEMIRTFDGEGTRCVLVTGWQGGDRLSLQADLVHRLGVEWAYMKEKYDAHAIIAKLTELLEDAMERRISVTTPMANIGASVEPYLFEGELLRRLSPTGGVSTLYTLVSRLVAPSLPLVAKEPLAPMASAPGGSLLGPYWSRGLATAVAVELDTSDVSRDLDSVAADVTKRLSLQHPPELLMQVTQRNVAGRLWELPGVSRSEFP
jgi:ActR/RegA family two-component response regulator